MVKKLKLLAGMFLIIGIFVLITTKWAIAATGDATAEINITVTQNDKASTAVVGLTTKIFDSGNNDITTACTITVARGTIKILSNFKKEDYYIDLTKNNDSVKIKATVSRPNTTRTQNLKVQVKWDDATSIATVDSKGKLLSKSGILGGTALSTTGAAVAIGTTISAYNKKGTVWSTKTDDKGAYKLYLVPGVYTLVVTGEGDLGKNISTNVKVFAGKTTGAMTDQKQITWTTAPTVIDFGYSLITPIASDSKNIIGTANVGSAVAAYEYSNSKYTLISKPVIVSKTKRFKLTLFDYQPGKNVVVRVTDAALNVKEDRATNLNNRTMKLTAMESTKAKINKEIVISFSDEINSKMNSYIGANITEIIVNDAANNKINLVLKDKNGKVVTAIKDSHAKNSDYAVVSGKIKFKAGILAVAQTYKVTVKVTGYTDVTVNQVVEK
jgi:hypothetical protein